VNAMHHIPHQPMTLRELLIGFISDAALSQLPAMPVQSLTLNSRDVKPGTVFVAIPGLRAHGVDYAQQAIANGAAAVLWEPVTGRNVPSISTPSMIAIPDLSSLLGAIAKRF